jgi:hypothetical protein
MGYQQYALVSMLNKDVYYIGIREAQRLEAWLETGTARTFRTTDFKSGARLTLQLASISSIVVTGGEDV